MYNRVFLHYSVKQVQNQNLQCDFISNFRTKMGSHKMLVLLSGLVTLLTSAQAQTQGNETGIQQVFC